MSQAEATTKKKRLESEVSQASGITCLSFITQNTELSSDEDDDNSDSSSAADQTEALLYDRRPSTIGIATIQQMQYPTKRRNRQVSWSIDDGENDVRDDDIYTTQQWASVPYDNNCVNSRRRVRRATESSLDTNALSFNKPQSPICTTCEQQRDFQPKLRSNTTSLLHGHENDIQRKILQDELMRRHDAQEHQRRRSRSATSLGNDRLHNRSDSHLYESLQPKTTAPDGRPVVAVVTMSPNGSYLHPVAETKVHNNNLRNSENTSGFSDDGTSAYADVVQHSEPSPESEAAQRKCYDFCASSLYRRGFYILLLINVTLIVLNTFGIVYSTVERAQIGHYGEVTGALRSEVCLDCDKLHETFKRELASKMNTNDKKCCVKSVETILPAFLKIADGFHKRVPQTEIPANVPAIQVKADSKRNDDKFQTSIVWENPDINTLEAKWTDTEIEIPKSGYYYVYSRVQYRKPRDNGKGKDSGFTIKHEIMKIEKRGLDKSLDKVNQKCFPSSTTVDIIHTSQLGSLHHLKEGDKLYIQLDYKQYLVMEDTIFGMFMVST